MEFVGCKGIVAEGVSLVLQGGCWDAGHLVLAVFSGVVAASFSLLAGLFVGLFVDRRPGTDDWHAAVDGRATVTLLAARVFLILLYGIVGAEDIPGWLAATVLVFVSILWLREFIIRQPHSAPTMNTIQAAFGAAFAWCTLCFILQLLFKPSGGVDLLFLSGSVICALATPLVVTAHRNRVLQARTMDITSDAQLSLWVRARLHLAFLLRHGGTQSREAVWAVGGALLSASVHRDGASSSSLVSVLALMNTQEHRQQRAASGAQSGGEGEGADSASAGSTGLAGDVVGWRAGVKFAPQPDADGATTPSPYPESPKAGPTTPAALPPSPSMRGLHTTVAAAQKAHEMLAGGGGAIHSGSGPSSTITRMGNNSQFEYDLSSGRGVLASEIERLVHAELEARNADSKLSPMLLLLLADVRRWALDNNFMEIMALSTISRNGAAPLDVAFWVENRLQHLRGMRTKGAGDGDLTTWERVLFDQHYSSMMRFQRQWYKAQIRLWSELMGSAPERWVVQAVAESLHDCLTGIDSAFRALKELNPDSTKVMRAYAVYLLRIRQDLPAGKALQAQVERQEAAALNQAQREVKHFRMFERNGMHLKLDETAALVMCSGDAARLGEITEVNSVAARMFLRPKSAMLGTNINSLIPSPIADIHSKFLEIYARTGRGKLMGSTRHLLAIDAAGNLLPLRGTLRESPPLEGSSAPQFTMLMQPLRCPEHHILFGGMSQGYPVYAADSAGYSLMHLSYSELTDSDTSVSIVHYFPEIDPSYASVWRAQREELGLTESEGAAGARSSSTGADFTVEQASQLPTFKKNGRTFSHLRACNASVSGVMAVIQVLSVPFISDKVHLLSWRRAAGAPPSHSKAGKGPASKLRPTRHSIVRPRPPARTLSPSALGGANPTGSTFEFAKCPFAGSRAAGDYSSRECPAGPHPDPHGDSKALSPGSRCPVTGASAGDLPGKVATEQSASSRAAPADRPHLAKIRRPKSHDDVLQAKKPHPPRTRRPSHTAVVVPEAALQSTSATDSTASALLSDTEDGEADGEEPDEGHLERSSSDMAPVKLKDRPTVITDAPPRAHTPPVETEHRPDLSHMDSDDTGNESGSADRSMAMSYQTGASSTGRNFNKRVLEAISSRRSHPSIGRMRWLFFFQLIMWGAYSATVLVLREQAMDIATHMLEALMNSALRVRHASAAVALVQGLVLHNDGISVQSAELQDELLAVEVAGLGRAADALQEAHTFYKEHLGVGFDDYLVELPQRDGSVLTLSPFEATGWLLSQLHVINALPVEDVTLRSPAVADVLNASAVLLQEALPKTSAELEREAMSWSSARETMDLFITFGGLAVAVLLVSLAALWMVSDLEAHRKLVLGAIATIPRRKARTLAVQAQADARSHMALVSYEEEAMVDSDEDEEPADVELMGDWTTPGPPGSISRIPSMHMPPLVHLKAARSRSGLSSGMSPTARAGRVTSLPNPSNAGIALRYAGATSDISAAGPTTTEEGEARHAHHRVTISPAALERRRKPSAPGKLSGGSTPMRPRKVKLLQKSWFSFPYRTLFKLMLPTVLVLIATVLLFWNWAQTTQDLFIKAERTFASLGIASETSTALLRMLGGAAALYRSGRIPGIEDDLQELTSSAVQFSALLLRGSSGGRLTGNALPGLEESHSAVAVLTGNACRLAQVDVNSTACGDIDDGILAARGLQGGVLRFAATAGQLAKAMEQGSISAGVNSTQLSAAMGSSQAYNALVFGPGSENLRRLQLLSTLVQPHMVSISTELGRSFHKAALDIPPLALVTSQTVIGIMLVMLVLALIFSILPRIRRLGERVFAVHTLVATVPSDVQVRLDIFHDVHRAINTVAASDAEYGSLSDESAMLMFSADDGDMLEDEQPPTTGRPMGKAQKR